MTQAQLAALEDNVLVAKDGDTRAFQALVQTTQNLTTTIALSIVKDLDASEDVAQQVYIKVWQQLPRLSKAQSFLPWLRQITRYTAINYLRDSKAGQRLDSQASDKIIDNLADPEEEYSTALSKTQSSELLRAFIDALPDESRELVLLYYREEESTTQVAELLELSEANVRKKLSRVRQQIREQWLKKYGKLALTTAPGIGFTSMLMNLVAGSGPAAAATVSASLSASAGKTGFWSKLAIWLGGGIIGAGLGILAVLFSTRVLISRIQDPAYIGEIKRNRNRMVLWIAFCSVLLGVSYEFTAGWWAPVLSYGLFALGLVRMVELTQLLAAQAGLVKTGRFCIDPADASWRRRAMNWAGPVIGGIGLVMGLVASGRF